jgi:hypothetical protein
MKLKLLLLGVATFSAAVSLAMIYTVFLLVHHYIGPEHREQRVDCSMTEFHPDYPAEVKAACRKR